MSLFGGFSQKQTWLYCTSPIVNRIRRYATNSDLRDRSRVVVTREKLPCGRVIVRGGTEGGL